MADDVQQLLIRMRLLGAAQTRNDLAATGVAVKGFGDAAQVTGDKTAFASEKAFLFGESMYSLRRWAFYGLTAIGATGAGILKMGYDFDEAKTRGVNALTSLVGGTRQAQIEVSKLVDLTHTSGLALGDLVTGTQNMLNFGFSVQQANLYMAAFANYAGLRGLGAGGVQSLSTIFDKIQGQGFMNTREFNALTELGIPGDRLMREALHLSPSEVFALTHNQLQVSASSALPAIASWLTRYSASQPHSLGQEWGILHGYLSQFAGTIGAPVFAQVDHFAATLTGKGGLLSRIAAAGKTGGMNGMLSALDPSGTLLNGWRVLTGVVTDAGRVLGVLWQVVKALSPVLGAVAAVLMVFAHHGTLLKAVVYGLTGAYILNRAAVIGVMLWTTLSRIALTAYYVTLGVAITVMRGATAAWWLFNAAISANPLVAFALAVVAVGAGIYLLYTRVTWFRDNLIVIAPVMAAALTLAFGPIGLAVTGLLLIIRYWKEIQGFFDGPQATVASLTKAGAQEKLVGTFGVTKAAELDAHAKLTVAQVRAGGGNQALVDAFKAALKEISLHGTLHADGGKIGDVAFKAKHKTEARR